MGGGVRRSGQGDRPAWVSPLVWPLLGLLKIYQRVISPVLPPSCRFYPSCSAYAVEALQVHGLVRGIVLTVWRLLRCAPWHPGGIDPVPPRRNRADARADGDCTAGDCTAGGRAAADRGVADRGVADRTGRAEDRANEERAPC